jgi:tetratricopeptide (TPR) repeat protein
MKFFCRILASFLLAAVLLPLPSVAQPRREGNRDVPSLHIRIEVRFADNSLAPAGVPVDLEDQGGAPLVNAQTDSSGKVSFEPIQAAIYIVRARQKGYLDATARVDLQNSSNTFALLTLKPDPSQPPPAANAGPTPAQPDNRAVPDLARKEFDEGRQSLQDQNLDEGVAHLQKAIGIYDQFSQAYTVLGAAYNQQKKWKEAQTALQKAIQLAPNEADAYFLLGATLNQERNFAAAESALKQGFQLVPDPPDGAASHYELGFAFFSQGRWREAEPHVAKTIAAQPDFALGHWLMAQVMLKKQDGPGAINEFQAYLKLDPNGPAAPSVRAVIPKIQAAIAKK